MNVTDQSPVNWPKKLIQTTENCYNIQEGRIVERSRGRYTSPVRIKNKNCANTTPSTPTQRDNSISSSVPGSPLSSKIKQRDKSFDLSDAFKFNDNNNEPSKANNNLISCDSNSTANSSNFNKSFTYRNSVYSVPYREKRHPLANTRLSCYKPLSEKKDHISNLKNYKSVDDFLGLDTSSSFHRLV